MAQWSSWQTEIRQREESILSAARAVLLERGYFGLTMERVASVSACPKGTMYQHFGCKEDLLVALAVACAGARLEMMERAAAHSCPSRERVVALGEAVALYTRLNPDGSRIMHMTVGPIREKASPQRLSELVHLEEREVALLHRILQDAVREGNLTPQDDSVLKEMAFGIWALVDGAFTLIERNSPREVLGIDNPFSNLFRVFSVLADGYGWRPLFHELDWEESLARARKEVFPEEAQRLYGEGNWYGDRG
ncbi:MAG TPA: TetR/AcrR family transcriptional regulator [Candidatus Hydrogenedentes bacterium]|nr:TetR/AcrR family transcriptional regulator [Candidatus Hydrogenedentota bacterium]HQE82094.1 TetR/AcrR family transcriptional regulator [Candidatus Hydrogenedentota bacterium]HQH52561.1 TetR/AcrR family transcriptional regulator [Candidatus Hydrogenedentota bacterium]HQM51154.1 TetR/AcrR family transcriptional regulator [Candidatus Hydrogenedentota bacterium]